MKRLCFLAVFFLLFSGCSAEQKITLSVRVCDVRLNPLSAEVFVLPQAYTGQCNFDLSNAVRLSATNGITECATLSFNSTKEWQCVTIVVFSEGYATTILYNCVLYANKSRSPVIKMFLRDGNLPDIIVFQENPPDDFNRKLIDDLLSKP
ncbi:MAG: hypothetical protein PHX51_06050 [Clostridia bacterium]|nr:hypothetical protein [Clostridia bacterium]